MPDELTEHIDNEEAKVMDLELEILRRFKVDLEERSAIRQDRGQSKEEADQEALRELTEWFEDLS